LTAIRTNVFRDPYSLLSLDELVQFSQRTRNQHHNLRLGIPRLASSRKTGIAKRIEDGLILLEGGLGLVPPVLLREMGRVDVEEHDEVDLLVLFVGGRHFAGWEVTERLRALQPRRRSRCGGDVVAMSFMSLSYDIGGYGHPSQEKGMEDVMQRWARRWARVAVCREHTRKGTGRGVESKTTQPPQPT
jgi:hypothetical protein